MRVRFRLRPSFVAALLIATTFAGSLVHFASSPGARFRMQLMRAKIADYLDDTGEPDARLALFEMFAREARASACGPAEDPCWGPEGWSWGEHDGLLVEQFYSGFEVRWNVYTFEEGKLELLGSSGAILG